MSRTYNAVFKVVTPRATRVIDRFHMMRLALLALDECRRRVQQVQLGHRGHSGEPLYQARKLLVIKATANDPQLQARLEGLLALGDAVGEVALAYGAKEAIARFYETPDAEQAAKLLRDVIDQCAKKSSSVPARTSQTVSHTAQLVRSDHRLSPGPGFQRPHRGDEQSLEESQTRALRIHQLRELSNTSSALRQQAQFQAPRLDCRPLMGMGLPARTGRATNRRPGGTPDSTRPQVFPGVSTSILYYLVAGAGFEPATFGL